MKTVFEKKCFDVYPMDINREFFQEERKDEAQEFVRQRILVGLAVLDENPKEYGRPFRTKVPKKTWNVMTIRDMKILASKHGHMASGIEQFLEWAYRIQNGESWETICNEADTAKWNRLVSWKNGFTRLVGGSIMFKDKKPAGHMDALLYDDYEPFSTAVPLIAEYINVA